MSINSRNKGKVGEREWAAWLTANGFPARRGVQYQGGPESPDIAGGIAGVHFEVKRVENLNIHNAIAQAVRDAGDEAIPVVAHRRNRGEWLITKLAKDYIALWRRCLAAEAEVRRLKACMPSYSPGTESELQRITEAAHRVGLVVDGASQIHPWHCPACDGDGVDHDEAGDDPHHPCKACKGTGKR